MIMEFFGRIVLWTGIFAIATSLPAKINLGGIFDMDGDKELEDAFRFAVAKINTEEPSILPSNSKLEVVMKKLDKENSFRATQLSCDLLLKNVTAIFGPQSHLPSMHVRSICDDLEVPHIESRWEYQLKRDLLSINLYPNPSVLNSAFITLIHKWTWKDFSLIYEEDEAAARIKDFLLEGEKRKWNIKLYQLKDEASYRDTFWEIKKSSKVKGQETTVVEHRIVLDVPTHNLYSVLKAAQQVGMVTEHEKYLITSLDLHTIPIEDFQYSKTNITGLRLVQQDTEAFAMLLKEVNNRRIQGPELTTLKTETALIYDSVKLLALGLRDMDAAKQISLFPSINCNQISKKGGDGTSLINFIKNVEMTGVTGLVKFDAEGFRSMVFLDIMYLTPFGLKKIGTILPGNNINVTDIESKDSDFQFMELESKVYRVATLTSKPYVMLRDSSKEKEGNDQYEGYVMDLLDALNQKINLRYEVYIVEGNAHGSEDEQTKYWNGIVGDVLRETADFGLADLTITKKRLEAVDFTLPFMQTGISILFRKPTEKVTSLFSFLSPFSGEVWLLVMGAYLFVTLSLFIVGRLSPYEWSNPHPCRQNDQVEENCFSLLNSMWFTIGSLMQQGSDVAPTAMSTRAITSIWYFFCLIMISSYTANLAAFLTIEKLVSPIEKVEDLANQEKIKYGLGGKGATWSFFKNSNIPTYQKMFKYFQRNPDVLEDNNEAGKNRVERGNYAFLMESKAIEYITERECNLTQVGGLLDNKAYGIAVKKGNIKLRNWLSTGILQLQEEGKLHQLYERWWKEKKGGGTCTAGSSSSSVNELGLGNVGGVFVVMLLGISLSAFVGIAEFLWNQRKLQRDPELSLFKLLMKEIRYAVSCGSSSKPAPKLKNSGEDKSEESNTPGFNSFY